MISAQAAGRVVRLTLLFVAASSAAAAQTLETAVPKSAAAKSDAPALLCDKFCQNIRTMLAARKNKFSGYRGKKITDENDAGFPEWYSTISLPGIERPCEIHGGSEHSNNRWECTLGTYASNDPTEPFARYLGRVRAALSAGWTEERESGSTYIFINFSPPGVGATIMSLGFEGLRNGRCRLYLYVINSEQEEKK